jgi:hypothetical protein
MVSRTAGSSFALGDLERLLGRPIRSLAEENDRALGILGEAIDLLGCGLDLKDYVLFGAHGPIVHQLINGSMSIDWMHQPTEDGNVVSRCLNFVVDAAVRLGV